MRRRSSSAELEHLRSLLGDLDALVYERDAGTGRLTYVSGGARALLGLAPEAIRAELAFPAARVHPDDRRTVALALEAALADGRPHDLEYRLLHADGSVIWVRDLGHVVGDARTPIVRGLLIDVTRQKLAEERQTEVELGHRRLIEHLPAIVYTESVFEDDAGVVYVSPQVHHMLGIDPEEWIGAASGWLAYIHPEDRDRVAAANVRSDLTGEPFAAEYRMLGDDGRIVWFHDESVLVRDDDGRPLFWQGVMLDVTEQRRAAELERALEVERAESQELRELDETKNTFLQAVSHDLRTPLAAILGLAVTLERDDVQLAPEEARDLASRIASNARRLDRMVNDLLDLDRLGHGQVAPNLVETDVGALVRALVADHGVVGDREVSLEASPSVAEVDPPKVERIIENLLANAARHTPPGCRVWASVRPDGDGVLLAVEDEGPGVAPELRESIFEPFRQGPPGAGHAPGVGIGLALVARFAELHDGRAWVEERVGGGASFRVWLPAHPAASRRPAPPGP